MGIPQNGSFYWKPLGVPTTLGNPHVQTNRKQTLLQIGQTAHGLDMTGKIPWNCCTSGVIGLIKLIRAKVLRILASFFEVCYGRFGTTARTRSIPRHAECGFFVLGHVHKTHHHTCKLVRVRKPVTLSDLGVCQSQRAVTHLKYKGGSVLSQASDEEAICAFRGLQVCLGLFNLSKYDRN